MVGPVLLLTMAAVDPAAPVAITMSAAPCYGNCPVYSARVTADGNGLFGDRSGQPPRRFTITPEQFRAFAAHVAPLVRVTGCQHFLDHTQPIDIIWVGADGSSIQRRYYQSCLNRDFPALAPLLREAPGLLPIGDLIRSQP